MNSYKKKLLEIVPIVLIFSSLSLQAQVINLSLDKHPLEAQIDSIFSTFNDLSKPGGAVAVVKDDAIIFKKGYGSANLEYDIPNTPSTVFHIASVSKQFTVFSILLLEKEGKLSFDDDIRKYIPEVPNFGKPITLRHLAAHTSGMRDQWALLRLAGWRWDDVITTEHILKIISKQKELNFAPGEAFTYCNSGFTLLAEVVARVSGQSFAEFTKAKIFDPLKMSSTLFYDDHEKIVKNRAYSYHRDQTGYKKSVLNFANVGATSLFTTVEDLALWSMNFGTPIVGDDNIFEKMNTLALLNNGETFGGAYGQFVNKHKGLNQISHGGADAGYRSYLGRFPDQKFAVMVLSNSAAANPVGLSLQVADLFLKDQSEVSLDVEEKTSSNKFIKLSKEKLTQYTGHYWNEAEAYSREILLKNDTLYYSRGNGNESLLIPISDHEFKMMNVGVDLIVQFKNGGIKDTMNVIIDGGDPIQSAAYIPVDYSSSELNEFIGTFYSPELSTTYTIIQKEKELIITHPRISDLTLSPIKKDLFSSNYGTLHFQRGTNQNIIGFKITSGRVSNLWFEKK